MMLNAITPIPTTRRIAEDATRISVTPNTNMIGAATDETIDLLVSANCIRRISGAESSVLASSRCLPSEKSQAKELGKAQGRN
jgi:hypothetical protein